MLLELKAYFTQNGEMILSLFTLPHVVPNMYEFLSSAEHKRRYIEEYGYNQTVDGSHWLS